MPSIDPSSALRAPLEKLEGIIGAILRNEGPPIPFRAEVRSAFGWTDVPEPPDEAQEEGNLVDLERHQANIPRLPIPTIKQTCETYLHSVRPLLTNEEYEYTEVCAWLGCQWCSVDVGVASPVNTQIPALCTLLQTPGVMAVSGADSWNSGSVGGFLCVTFAALILSEG